MELQREDSTVRLVCYCGRRLDTLELENQAGEVVSWPRHWNARNRRNDAPAVDVPPRWSWNCKRCPATPTVKQATLTEAHHRAVADGHEVLALGVDL